MLKVLHRRKVDGGLATYHDVQLSDRRRFGVTSRRGVGRLEGVPPRKDHRFWREWRRYIGVLRGEEEPKPGELQAYQIGLEKTEGA